MSWASRALGLALFGMVLFGFPASAAEPAAEPTAGEVPAYVEVGGSLGTPAVLNLVVGYQTPRFGVRGSGLYFGSSVHGFQISPGVHFGPANKAWHGIGAVFGTMNLLDQKFTYAGLAYQLTTRGGFYLEAGFSGGSGDFTSPQLLLQIGGVARIPTNEAATAAKTAPR